MQPKSLENLQHNEHCNCFVRTGRSHVVFFLSDVNSFVRSFDGFLVSAQQHPAIDTLVLTGQPKIIKTMLFMSLIKRILGHAYYDNAQVHKQGNNSVQFMM